MSRDYDASQDAAIWVYCDSPNHPKKTARIELFAKIHAFGDYWLTKGERENGPGLELFGAERINHRCTLCGLNWPCTADSRDRVLDAVAADPKYLRTKGVSRISLYELIVIASIQA